MRPLESHPALSTSFLACLGRDSGFPPVFAVLRQPAECVTLLEDTPT
jgi:hypothetical protein